jgi:hypothetical protein
MPKLPSSPPKVKNEPYAKTSPSKQQATSSSSVKSEPTEKTSSGTEKAPPAKKGGKGVTWTPDMDKGLVIHVLSNSNINLRFNWADLQKNKFPHLTVVQVSSIQYGQHDVVFRD